MSQSRPSTARVLRFLSALVVVLLAFCSLTSPQPAAAAPAASSPSDSSKSRDLYCALCETVMYEMEAAISRLEASHGHTVQTAWRIDEKRRIPYARTEAVLLQLLEDDVPPLLKHYGVTNHTGRQRLVRKHDAPQIDTAPLLPDDSHHSAAEAADNSTHSALPYSASEFSSSLTLSDTLTALYERMIDSYLEDIMLAFHKQRHSDIPDALCVKTIRACKKGTTFEPFRRPRRQGQEQADASSGQPAEQISHVDL